MIKFSQKEVDYIVSKDPALLAAVNKFGIIEEAEEMNDIFSAIVKHIISQMLSNKVAEVINNRILAIVGSYTPNNILNADNEELRKCGTSYAKIKYIKNFCMMVKNDVIELDHLDGLSDEELVRYLTKIPGVGTWTAEMIACFTLGRLNIFSWDDVALKNGIMKVHIEFKTLSKKRFEKLRKLYTPYCSVAAAYYYKVNDYGI